MLITKGCLQLLKGLLHRVFHSIPHRISCGRFISMIINFERIKSTNRDTHTRRVIYTRQSAWFEGFFFLWQIMLLVHFICSKQLFCDFTANHFYVNSWYFTFYSEFGQLESLFLFTWYHLMTHIRRHCNSASKSEYFNLLSDISCELTKSPFIYESNNICILVQIVNQ